MERAADRLPTACADNVAGTSRRANSASAHVRRGTWNIQYLRGVECDDRA
jgi:hypothetical protein